MMGEPWHVRPWVFVPEAQRELLARKVTSLLDPAKGSHLMPGPLATSLETVAPRGRMRRHLNSPASLKPRLEEASAVWLRGGEAVAGERSDDGAYRPIATTGRA